MSLFTYLLPQNEVKLSILYRRVYVPAGSPPPNILDAGVAFASQATDGGEGGRIWAQTADPALAERFFREQNERHVKYMGQREHWYLEAICTRPEGKGKGVGSGLLTWGVDRADANGCEAYLEASPEGRPLFEKFGWRVLERLEYLDGGYVECSMVRDAALGRGC
jgi:GNAT superfamily N-acetyltransferase